MTSSEGFPLSKICLAWAIPFVVLLFTVRGAPGENVHGEDLLEKMKNAYDEVEDYQAKVVVRTHEAHGSMDTRKFLYTFRKPNHIRMDFEHPQPGMVLVYPDRDGKVLVRPLKWIPFMNFQLDPDNRLLVESSGQRFDQTDLGLLIKNISHSLTDGRRGPIEIFETDGEAHIRVLAEDHFRQGEIARYHFIIDKALWLPVGVHESTPDGRLRRKVVFDDLRVNVGISDDYFDLK